jgi:hypothetical protein
MGISFRDSQVQMKENTGLLVLGPSAALSWISLQFINNKAINHKMSIKY